MAKKENLMNGDHKATNETYRENYDKIFKKKKEVADGCNTTNNH